MSFAEIRQARQVIGADRLLPMSFSIVSDTCDWLGLSLTACAGGGTTGACLPANDWAMPLGPQFSKCGGCGKQSLASFILVRRYVLMTSLSALFFLLQENRQNTANVRTAGMPSIVLLVTRQLDNYTGRCNEPFELRARLNGVDYEPSHMVYIYIPIP